MGQYSSYQDDFTANTSRYPSPGIWTRLDALSERDGRTVGLWDDFVGFGKTWGTTEGNYTPYYKTFGSSGAAATDGDAVGGVLVMTEATENEGMAIGTHGLPFQIINTGGMLGFEARIKCSTINDAAGGMFVGLMDQQTYAVGIPITTGGVILTTGNFVGWYRIEADGDMLDAICQENGETLVTVKADAHTLVADTWVKVGFLFEPEKKLVTYFKNGVPLAETKAVSDTAGSAFPNDVRLGMCFGFTSGATTPSVWSMDWWKCYQHIPA